MIMDSCLYNLCYCAGGKCDYWQSSNRVLNESDCRVVELLSEEKRMGAPVYIRAKVGEELLGRRGDCDADNL
jgi:hypothetical protein